MLLPIYLQFSLILLGTLAEVSFGESPPYPASGFRPNAPFNLPSEYLAPLEVTVERGKQQDGLRDLGLQITEERVDFVGQTKSLAEPRNAYLPPRSPDFVDKQRLPNSNRPLFNSQQDYNRQPLQSGSSASLAQEYGPPSRVFGGRYSSQRNFQDNDEQEAKRQVFEALNSALEVYNNVKQTQQRNQEETEDVTSNGYALGRYSQGQYFILNPDKTLQRVTYTTLQDENEAPQKGFTAQLKYSQIGELHDPLYKYNEEGQLVRVLKK